jgi:hypothetical protein
MHLSAQVEPRHILNDGPNNDQPWPLDFHKPSELKHHGPLILIDNLQRRHNQKNEHHQYEKDRR